MAGRAVAQAEKKGKRRRATFVFPDESGFSQRPSVRRTWAPRGQTPVLREAFNWKRFSAIGALACNAKGERGRLFLSLQPGNIRGLHIKAFLRSLRRHLKGRVILVWDGLPAHRSADVEGFLGQQRHWLEVHRFPAYAPELNPMEYVWGQLDNIELANFCPDNMEVLASQVRRGVRRIRRRPDLAKAFLKHSGLFPELLLY